MPKNASGQDDPTVGGERTYSGVSGVINEMEPGDLWGNDFPQAYVESTGVVESPQVTPQMYDAVIASKYGPAAAARAAAVRDVPVDLPPYEQPVQSKAQSVLEDESLGDAASTPAERTAQLFLHQKARWDETSTANAGRIDFGNKESVMSLNDAEIYRLPIHGKDVRLSGAEIKLRFREDQELMHQMQVLKAGARQRAEEAAAQAEPPMPVDSFRTRQTMASIADASDAAKQQLRDELNVISREEFESVAGQLAEVHAMLLKLTGDKADAE